MYGKGQIEQKIYYKKKKTSFYNSPKDFGELMVKTKVMYISFPPWNKKVNITKENFSRWEEILPSVQ